MGWCDITHLKTGSETFSSTPYRPLGVENLNYVLKGSEKHRAIGKRDFHAGSSGWAQPSLWAWAVVLLLDRPQRPVYALQGSVYCPCLNNEGWSEVMTWPPHPPYSSKHLSQGECGGHLSAAWVSSEWSRPLDFLLGHSSPLSLLPQALC